MREDDDVGRDEPALPAWRAFVVQFSRESERRLFAGRIQHLSSGRQARFESPAALVATLRRLLDELGKVSP